MIRAFASGCQESLSSKPSRSVSDSAHNLDRAATESFRRRLQQLAIGRALDIDREREESVVIMVHCHCHCSLSCCCCCPAGRAAVFIFLLQHNIREGFIKKKKVGIFPLGGEGAFLFDIFSHFQKLIQKNPLNHPKMQRIFFCTY